ncbi:MAG: UvrD-helicase domain-containing protein [Clostridia bacterium]|nr:UvrD-helicase domain-containing protein [Clostridia bacterium]
MTENDKIRFLKAKRALFDKYYGFLNEKQREAVYTVNGPVLILAGAGSGKTTVLVNRIGHIIKYGNAYYTDNVPDFITEDTIEDLESAVSLEPEMLKKYMELFSEAPCPPWNILAITFTNKAANEIKERLNTILNEDASDIWAGTFHSICMRILRKSGELVGYRPGFAVCDTDDAKKTIASCVKDLNINDKILSIRDIMNVISRAKDRLMTPADFAEECGNDFKYKMIARVYELYQKRLEESNVLDFDDIIMKTVKLLSENEDVLSYYQNKFRYISVDEYQDTNKAQLELVTLLAGFYKNIMVVGDDDQSIYKFRGATIENILSFDTVYPDTKIVKLEQNYRSTSTILGAANSLICKNYHKHLKKLWCDNEKGEKIVVKETEDARSEASYIIDRIVKLKDRENLNYKDFAVLYRINAQSQTFESIFSKSGIPYRILGALRFYDREEIKDIIAYLHAVNNLNDSIHLRRIIAKPRRRIGDSSIDVIYSIAGAEGIPVIKAMENATEYPAINKNTQTAMKEFVKLMKSLVEDSESMPLHALVKEIIKRTGYENMIIQKGPAESERLENLDELVSAVAEYEEEADEPTLAGFLEMVSLITDVDRYDADADAVTLITVHSAKGLEFPVVFLPGMEDGLFPSQQCFGNKAEEEEERRLAYVAITRAKKLLTIIHAKERMIHGSTQYNRVSRFVKDIDEGYLDIQRLNNRFGGSLYSRTMAKQDTSPGILNFVDSYSRPATPKPTLTALYEAGDRINHVTFGDGTVLSVTKTNTDSLYEIAFDRVGTKKLMATYAQKLMKKL